LTKSADGTFLLRLSLREPGVVVASTKWNGAINEVSYPIATPGLVPEVAAKEFFSKLERGEAFVSTVDNHGQPKDKASILSLLRSAMNLQPQEIQREQEPAKRQLPPRASYVPLDEFNDQQWKPIVDHNPPQSPAPSTSTTPAQSRHVVGLKAFLAGQAM